MRSLLAVLLREKSAGLKQKLVRGFAAIVLLTCITTALLGQVPPSKHVWVITLENHSYESVVGNATMPYYNSLASKYTLAKQYYSNQHSSLPALMWLVAGQFVTEDNYTQNCFDVDNVVRHLLAKGMTWRSYQEDLPYPGYTGLSWMWYVRRHNPLIDFTDTCAPKQHLNSVPYTQLATDLANGTTPNYAYVTPNLQHDAHDGTLAEADAWLAANLPAILARPEFQPGNDGLMFVVFDEGDLGTDDRCSPTVPTGCGGRVATLAIGPQVKNGYQSDAWYQHPNLLRTVCDAMGFGSCPAAGQQASPMLDAFAIVSVLTPKPQQVVSSPVKIQATTSDNNRVYAMQVYVDHILRYQASSNSINTSLPMTSGSHYLTVQAWDTAGGIRKTHLWITVN